MSINHRCKKIEMKNYILLIFCSLLVCACSCSESSSKKKSRVTPQEESKTLSASTISLKGKHAALFKVAGDTYKLNLVNTKDGWEVRAKITLANKSSYDNIKDKDKYEQELTNISGVLINGSDVEIESLDIDEDDLEALMLEDLGDEATITCKTYGYHHFSYEEAKSIYDKTVGLLLSGIELKQIAKGRKSSTIDDDLSETIDDVKVIVEAEGELLKALGGMLK